MNISTIILIVLVIVAIATIRELYILEIRMLKHIKYQNSALKATQTQINRLQLLLSNYPIERSTDNDT